MNTELRRKAKTTLINNAVFRKFVEIVTKNRNYLASEPNYNITKNIFGNLLAIEMEKKKKKKNKKKLSI